MKREPAYDLRSVSEKTLEELEGVSAPDPSFGSHLVQTVHRLYSKPVGSFSVEDLRIMLGQGRGVPWLLPLALTRLEAQPLAEGDYYEGDLLLNVFQAGAKVWSPRSAELKRAVAVAHKAAEELERLDTTEDHRVMMRAAIARFLEIHEPAS